MTEKWQGLRGRSILGKVVHKEHCFEEVGGTAKRYIDYALVEITPARLEKETDYFKSYQQDGIEILITVIHSPLLRKFHST